jgi:hypothetical protein
MEGTAEWAAFTALDRLRAPEVKRRRTAAIAAADRYLIAHPVFTPVALRGPGQFTSWRRTIGDVLAYQVVYTLAERLVQRRGVPAVVSYFRSFRGYDDTGGNFERAFSQSTAAFMTELRGAIRAGASQSVGTGPPDTVSSP